MGESNRRQSGISQQGAQRPQTADQEDDQRARATHGFRPRDSAAIKLGTAFAPRPSVAGLAGGEDPAQLPDRRSGVTTTENRRPLGRERNGYPGVTRQDGGRGGTDRGSFAICHYGEPDLKLRPDLSSKSAGRGQQANNANQSPHLLAPGAPSTAPNCNSDVPGWDDSALPQTGPSRLAREQQMRGQKRRDRRNTQRPQIDGCIISRD